MSRFRAVPYEDQSDVDLTSMLDVVFIMLIFFIVTATFVNEKGLSVDVPISDEIRRTADAITVTVEPNSRFLINGYALSAASVHAYVRALYGENPDADFTVILAPGSVVKDAAIAIDAGRRIGVEVIPIARSE